MLRQSPRLFLRGQHMLKVNNDIHSTLEVMSREVISKALDNANVSRDEVTACFVGNMLSGVLQKQSQLASFVCQSAGLRLKDSMTVDSACGSGQAALRLGIMALLSGFHETVVVVGIEYMKHPSREELTKALAQASDWNQEGAKGATFVGLNDLLHDLYIKTYPSINPDDFYLFSQNAHRNAVTSEHALLRKPVSLEEYSTSKLLGKRVRLFDACPTANGCAAIVLSTKGVRGQDPIILGSDCKTDYIALNKRANPLKFCAVEESVKTVFKQAQIKAEDISVFEAHDAYSIMGALSLESTFCAPGEGIAFAKAGNIGLSGQLPMSTFGGLKARGHPVGASGVYQICELMLQVTGKAGKNQVKDAKIGLTSSFGGAATTVTTHVVGI
jgi:acetyl-CoA C-acetyltransferase